MEEKKREHVLSHSFANGRYTMKHKEHGTYVDLNISTISTPAHEFLTLYGLKQYLADKISACRNDKEKVNETLPQHVESLLDTEATLEYSESGDVSFSSFKQPERKKGNSGPKVNVEALKLAYAAGDETVRNILKAAYPNLDFIS